MKHSFRTGFTILLLVALCTWDCAAKKRPPTPPDPKFMAIQNISVLPIVDARAGKKAGVNLTGLQGGVVKILKRKRYPVGAVPGSAEKGQLDVEDLQTASPSYIKKLGPADARWVMVVCLEDVASKLTFGSTGNAVLGGYLFDKDGGELVWKGRGVGQAGQGGLMGMAMKGMMSSAAIDSAMASLFASMPDRPKPGK